jgi:hypothetical protein
VDYRFLPAVDACQGTMLRLPQATIPNSARPIAAITKLLNSIVTPCNLAFILSNSSLKFF